MIYDCLLKCVTEAQSKKMLMEYSECLEGFQDYNRRIQDIKKLSVIGMLVKRELKSINIFLCYLTCVEFFTAPSMEIESR